MLMVDISSNRVPTNLHEHWLHGHRVIGIKVTEGVSYVWTEGLQLADRWHSFGPDAVVVFYHFATAGHPGRDQAVHYLAAVKPHLRWRDKYCVDVEGQPRKYRQWATGEAKAVHNAFIDTVNTAGPWFGRLRRRLKGLTYSGPYFLREQGIRKRGGWRLWLAAYGAKVPFVPAGWLTWMAWQFTDVGQFHGMPAAGVDTSRIKLWVTR